MRTKEIPLKIEKLSEEEENEFLIVNPKEILSILQAIAQRKSRVALHFNDENSVAMTQILAADINGGVWLDGAPAPIDNRTIERSNRIFLVSTHNQAKVQFATDSVVLGLYEDSPAFNLVLPRRLLRLQRRDSFRLPAPASHALKCIIPPAPDKANIHEVAVMDISVGGIALVYENSALELRPGTIYEHCQINLPELGTLDVAIQVKNIFEVTDRNGKEKRRAGCVFVKPDGKTTTLLQRYVAQMQMDAASMKR